jgi:hypothetical protein
VALDPQSSILDPPMTDRREFLEQLGAVAVLGALPPSAPVPQQAREWDLSWTTKLDGIPHKALYDCTEIEGGNGVARAGIWESQYQSVLGAKPSEIKTVLILRHVGVALALRQDAWDKFEIGKVENVKDNDQPTDWNPALSARDRGDKLGTASDRGLTGFIAKGGIVLACNLALQKYVRMYRDKDGVDGAEAQRRAAAAIVPGIILQPSGVFAAVRAGQAGCVYVKAS